MISVTDNGMGMTDEVLARCFEPFFTTKEIGKSSGLGLSQVLGFVKQSGGGLRIETQPGKGTTVRVYLPRASSVPVSQTSPKTQSVNIAGSATKPAILVVDDDAGVRDVTASILRERGFDVEEAPGGEAALRVLNRRPEIALAVVDFAMPGMNGVDLARHARARRPDLPVLFVTGYADTHALGGIAEDQIIRKPFEGDELEARVRRAIGRSKSFPAAVAPRRAAFPYIVEEPTPIKPRREALP